MQTCANCGHENSDDLHFCAKCASTLRGAATIPTVAPSFREQLGRMVRQTTGLLRRRKVMLHIQGAPGPVPLPEARQVILGRISTDKLETPDLDLTAFGALDMGVSRAHAALYHQRNEVTIVDMGSANGTYLNGDRLKPGQPYIVRNHDEIHLAQLAIKIHFE